MYTYIKSVNLSGYLHSIFAEFLINFRGVLFFRNHFSNKLLIYAGKKPKVPNEYKQNVLIIINYIETKR